MKMAELMWRVAEKNEKRTDKSKNGRINTKNG